MVSDSGLKVVDRSRWLSGFWNMLSKENGRWWNTHRWLVHSAVWMLLLNGIVVLSLYVESKGQGGVMVTPSGSPKPVELFFILMSVMAPIGVMILMQSSVVREKQSGTAEWVLSAPLSREAFIISKLVANSLWILAILVLMQGLAFELVLMAFGVRAVPVLNLLGGLALQGLHLLFWITLSLMLGAFFNGRGPVVGIPLVLLSFQDLIGALTAKYVPWITLIFPKRLPELAAQVANGEPVYSWIPLMVMTACMILFSLAAIWRFRREEF